MGEFNGFVKEKATELRINVSEMPKKLVAKVGKNKVKLTEARSMAEFLNAENVYFYDAAPNLNKFATKDSEFEKLTITKNPQLLVKLASSDITSEEITLNVEGYSFNTANTQKVTTGTQTAPSGQITAENVRSLYLKTNLE